MEKSGSTRNQRRWAREVERVERRPGDSRVSYWLRVLARAGPLWLGKLLRPALNDTLGRYSKIGAPAYFDRELFDWVPALEASWEPIRKEAEFLLEAPAQLPKLHEISPDHGRIEREDRWKVYFLKGYGHWLDDNCRQCPETARAVRRIPGLESAFFSILEPGTHIQKHRGPTRAIFTAHLGLMLPKDRDNCWIKVDGITRHWDAGRALIFDDTYLHRVRNETAEDRVVLLLHIRRPLRFPGWLLGRLVYRIIRWTPFVRDALRNQREWNERLATNRRGTVPPG